MTASSAGPVAVVRTWLESSQADDRRSRCTSSHGRNRVTRIRPDRRISKGGARDPVVVVVLTPCEGRILRPIHGSQKAYGFFH
jgi:hypothetical protein